jgi:hypothetical protein
VTTETQFSSSYSGMSLVDIPFEAIWLHMPVFSEVEGDGKVVAIPLRDYDGRAIPGIRVRFDNDAVEAGPIKSFKHVKVK